ncbi:MAG: hypothetical protein ABI619_04935 [Betaproteobacteria bacterium]
MSILRMLLVKQRFASLKLRAWRKMFYLGQGIDLLSGKTDLNS